MRKLDVLERDDRRGELVGEPALFEKLRELTRHGYVPDAGDAPETGILLRHDNAPALILKPDGSIELPASQPPRREKVTAEPVQDKRIYWRRTFFVVVLTIGVWFLSLAIAATVINILAE